MVSLFDAGAGLARELPVELVTPGVRAVSLLEFFPVPEAAEPPSITTVSEEVDAVGPAHAEQEQAQQLHAMLDAAREQAAGEARAASERACQESLAEERARIAALSTEFALDRKRYFAAAEAQVVKLALAVARRVLLREASTDPQHLLPVVHAVLSRVGEESVTTMRVPPAELAVWSARLEHVGAVQVVGDATLSAGEATLETPVGQVELGVLPQLDEVERAFGELAQRGGA